MVNNGVSTTSLKRRLELTQYSIRIAFREFDIYTLPPPSAAGMMLTATAMGFFEAEIARAVVLALFVPLVISSGGNSGSQASTLVIRALALSRLSGETPWAALGRLGVELRIDELIELSSSLVLAGSEGAKIKESLAAKADSLRRHEAAVAEAKAQEASERMSVPIAVLLFGFLIFLGYPAVAHIFTSL